MRTLFEPRLIDATAREPGLFVDIRDHRRALLFDLANLSVLPPRLLLRVSHVFVTHTHMDHFAGFDYLLAMGLGRVGKVVLWGGPRFIEQVEHKLRAYTWNVVHRYPVPMRLQAHELHADGSTFSASFDSRQAFVRSDESASSAMAGDIVHDELTFRVRAAFVDHEMPVLAYALEEKARVRVAPDRLAAMGLTTGAWLRELKHAVLSGANDDTPIPLRWRDKAGEHTAVKPLGELKPLVLDIVDGLRIGYVTDLRYTPENVAALERLLTGVQVLYIESVFLQADLEHALRKNHLTAQQAGTIARRLGAKALVPFHFSPRYEGRTDEVIAQARAAWSGSASP